MKNERLQKWFGLSYASWLTIPRVLMENMPDEWQEKMAELLEECDAYYPNCGEDGISFSVQCKLNNKFIKMPKYLGNYRYPDWEKLNEFRGIKND